MTHPMSYFLAIDAGGTKADYVLADDTRILARVQGGTIKRMRTTAEIAEQNLDLALKDLVARSGVPLTAIAHACVGTAGNTVPLVTEWLRTQFGRRLGGDLLLLGDVEIALDAAFPAASGVLLLAGTGSNVAGRSHDGLLVGAGGYGPVLSDQGSGHRIGLQALRAAFLARDEGRSTALLTSILDLWQLASAEDLVAFANTCPASRFSSLTHVVLACAQQGDAVAHEVMQREGEDLAYLALLLHRRLLARDGALWSPRFAFAGSILEHVPPVREAVIVRLHQEIPNASVAPGVVDPVLGALWRARHSARLTT